MYESWQAQVCMLWSNENKSCVRVEKREFTWEFSQLSSLGQTRTRVAWELKSESLHESFLNFHCLIKREQELHESWKARVYMRVFSTFIAWSNENNWSLLNTLQSSIHFFAVSMSRNSTNAKPREYPKSSSKNISINLLCFERGPNSTQQKLWPCCLTGFNNVLLNFPTLFTVLLSTILNNIVESETGVTMLNIIVDNCGRCEQQNIV